MDLSPSARISRRGAVAAGEAGAVCARVKIANTAARKNAMAVLRTRMCSVYRKNSVAAGDRRGNMLHPYGGSLDRYGFCQVAGLVYVASAADRDVVGQQLQRNYFEKRRKQLWSWRNLDNVIGCFAGQVVAGGDHRNYDAVACAHFLNVGDTLLIARDRIRIIFIVAGQH